MKLNDLAPTPVFDAYCEFAVKRQEVFFSKMQNYKPPWTTDPIIQQYKFTNAYRASDRVSQYLIRNVIYSDQKFSADDICFRILFFKLFNKIETWEYMENALGEISYKQYNFERYNQLFLNRLNQKERIYSAAYIMPSGKNSFGYEKKHQNNLQLLEYMMKTNFPAKLSKVKSFEELYLLLLSYPTIGPFLAFQYSVDINYSELCDFSEMSYVVAGPGAQNGIHKCFSNIRGMLYEDVIKLVAENIEEEFDKRNLRFQSLFGRPLQLIDCQNLFCETDKYARIAYPEYKGLNDRKRIKQHYIDRHLKKINYFYPPKWGINRFIGKRERE